MDTHTHTCAYANMYIYIHMMETEILSLKDNSENVESV